MVSQQDSFVAGLLNDKLHLIEAIKRLEESAQAQAHAAPASATNALQQQQVAELTAYSEALENELEQTRTVSIYLGGSEQSRSEKIKNTPSSTSQELLEKARATEHSSHHSDQQAQQIKWLENKLNGNREQATGVASARSRGGGGGPPYILVLIDG